MVKKKDLSRDDRKVWDNYIKNPSDVYDKEKKNFTNHPTKDRFTFDLHGFTLVEANIKVSELIIFCIKKKFKEILLITGKGLHSTTGENAYVSQDLSKLKFSVPEFINNNEELKKHVISISDANINDGGAGAILIKLKNL